ncbi:SEL1-like repeat protein [Sphingomonas bacterium]|uniref:SEL1-like repeat protein n=1 Tax=Sphingomonas bacterium TaxID=1895847 RepID=UPI0015768D5D|nr:SEL1-like repeat protein [Sphingomonas bacterium]
MGGIRRNTKIMVESRLQEAARGDHGACYDLGICYQTGTSGVGVDLVEAHKWFNLAAVHGIVAAQQARTEVAEDMTAREIAAAQRAARDWIAGSQRRAA